MDFRHTPYNIQIVLLKFSLAKVLLLFDICMVLVGPFCEMRLHISQISCTFASFLQALASALAIFLRVEITQKKCGLLLYRVIQASTPIDSNIRRKSTLTVRTFTISRKSILICRRLNYSSIK